MTLLQLQLRLMIGGCVLCVLGVVLFVVRGSPFLIVLPIVGVVLIVVGLLWRGPKGTDRGGEENKPGVW